MKKPGTKADLAAMIAKQVEQGCKAWQVDVQTLQGVLVRVHPLVLGEAKVELDPMHAALYAPVERCTDIDAVADRITELGNEVRAAGLKVKVKPVPLRIVNVPGGKS